MDNVALLHDSLGLSFELLEHLVSDLTQEQADWTPPGNANPIGSLCWHIVAYVDQLVHEWGMGQVPLRHSAGWQEKVVTALPPENPEDPYWEVRAVREGLRVDLPALHDYARATARTILSWVTSLAPEDLDRTIPTPLGDHNLGQFLQIFIICHINNHIGEIAALKGCQGLKGYPW